MPLYRDEGVILRTHKLGEADRIVTVFMKDHGVRRIVAKGVRRTSSKFGARLEPFMVADLQCYEGRTLDTITQAESLGSYGSAISSDYDRFRMANVMVETAEKINTEEPSKLQYALLVGGLRTLAAGAIDGELVRDAYLLRSVALAGWAPGFDDCVRCGRPGVHTSLSIQLGGAICETCRPPGSLNVQAESMRLLAALLAGDWETATSSSERDRDQVAGFTAAYLQWHLERSLKSLSFNSGRH